MDAARGAREAGAAAWTFHTQAAYRLDETRLADRLDAQGHHVLEQPGTLPRVPGGRANGPADGVN